MLLRGKTSQTLAAIEPAIASNVPPDDDGSPVEDAESADERRLPRAPIDDQFGRLIALPSVKLTPGNLYGDIKNRNFLYFCLIDSLILYIHYFIK